MNRFLTSNSAMSQCVSTKATVRLVTVTSQDVGQRLDNYLSRILKGVPKSRIYRLIRKGEVRVNKKRCTADYRLQPGDLLRIPPVRTASNNAIVKPHCSVMQRLESAILYEDAGLLIINKPAGMAVHGGSGISCGVIEALRHMRPLVKGLELVHRLDRDTSGCLMIAKKRSMLRFLHEQLRADTAVTDVCKTYHALVAGHWSAKQQVIDVPLQKNTLRSGERVVRVHTQGKPSTTRYRVLERFPDATLVEARLLTGRTHQIRVHCQYAGHSLLGDTKYGAMAANKLFRQYGLQRLFLHANYLQLTLPNGQPLAVTAPLAKDLQAVLTVLRACL